MEKKSVDTIQAKVSKKSQTRGSGLIYTGVNPFGQTIHGVFGYAVRGLSRYASLSQATCKSDKISVTGFDGLLGGRVRREECPLDVGINARDPIFCTVVSKL